MWTRWPASDVMAEEEVSQDRRAVRDGTSWAWAWAEGEGLLDVVHHHTPGWRTRLEFSLNSASCEMSIVSPAHRISGVDARLTHLDVKMMHDADADALVAFLATIPELCTLEPHARLSRITPPHVPLACAPRQS
jgi:hypothetical protein